MGKALTFRTITGWRILLLHKAKHVIYCIDENAKVSDFITPTKPGCYCSINILQTILIKKIKATIIPLILKTN